MAKSDATMVAPRPPHTLTSLERHSKYGRNCAKALLVTRPVVILLLPFITGCDNSGQTKSVPATRFQESGYSDPNQFTFDAGVVLSGQEISKEFVVKNDGAEVVSVLSSDGDVRTTCGCSRLTLAAKTIEPGNSAVVSVAIRTAGQSGKFSAGGTIVWTSPSGATRMTHFLVNATIRPALKTEPEAICFSEDDARAGRFRELRVSSLVALDWAKLQVAADSSALRLGPPHRDGDILVLPVACDLGSGIETLDSAITLVAPVIDSASSLSGKSVSLRVPVTARQVVEFAVSPRTILVTERAGKGTATLVAYGRRLTAGPQVIRAVRSDRGQVEWTVSKPNSLGTMIMSLTLSANKDKPTMLEIEVTGTGLHRVPLEWQGECLPTRRR